MQKTRLGKLREYLESNNFDTMVVTNLPNIFYLCGFTGSTAVLVVTLSDAVIIVDSRYTLQAGLECSGVKVTEYRKVSQMNAVGNILTELDAKRSAYESDSINVADFNDLRRSTRNSTVFRGTKGVVRNLRSIKDQNEIELCKQAAKITDLAMAHIHSKLVPGVTEKEIELELMCALRKNGADKEGFDSIIAFGEHAACPHASPTLSKLENNSFVKLDFGACYKNYNADITRTVAVGDPGGKFRDIYDIVLGAQLAAIESVKPGRTGHEIDNVARNYIISAGYGNNFGHGLGHALGIEVHDGPGFSPSSSLVLQPGMIITVEPGIYIEGWGGIRIEDDIVVTQDGCESITHYPK